MPKAHRAVSGYLIYAVVLREHPALVKIGRTRSWGLRRPQYVNWNLSDGHGIQTFVVYGITEEYVDLALVEAVCLAGMERRPHRGKEWFIGTLRDAQDAIERGIASLSLSFVKLVEGR